MCEQIIHNNRFVTHNDYIVYKTLNQTALAGKWGINNNLSQHVKIESYRIGSLWSNYRENRGVIELNAFCEKNYRFFLKSNGSIFVPILFDNNYDFAIITQPAKQIVAPIYKRQPIMIKESEINLWLNDAKMYKIHEDELTKTQEKKT